MAKSVGFILLDQFAEWESAPLASALSLLGEGRYTNCFLTSDGGTVEAVSGMKVQADGALSQAKDCDALVLVGSLGWKTAQSEKAMPVVREFAETGKLIGAIDAGVSCLASLGLLNDVEHTAGSEQELADWAGASYTGQDRFVQKSVVRDGSLVTAPGTGVLPFAREMLLALGISAQEADSWYAYYETPKEA